MNEVNVVVISLALVIGAGVIGGFNYSYKRMKLIAEAEHPIAVACAIDIDSSITAPNCTILLTSDSNK